MRARELQKMLKTLEELTRSTYGADMYQLAKCQNIDQLATVVNDVIGPDRDANRIGVQAYEKLLEAGYWIEMMFETGEEPYPKPPGLAQFDFAVESPLVPRPPKKPRKNAKK